MAMERRPRTTESARPFPTTGPARAPDSSDSSSPAVSSPTASGTAASGPAVPGTTAPDPVPSGASSSGGAAAEHADVIVVGAGPTGLLLAGDLAAAGLRVTLIERRPDTVSNLTRALVVHARTLEQLDARGLADALVARGHPLARVQLFGYATLDMGQLPSRFPFVLVTPQFEVERLLLRRAREAGVTFRYGTEVCGLDQDAAGVTVHVRDGDGDGRARASYVVGTDGVRSTVRGLLRLPFPGRSVIRSLVLADVRLAREPGSALTVNATDDAFALIGSFGDGWYRVVGWNRHQQADDAVTPDLDEVRRVTRLALGSDYGMHDARWTSRFHSDERQVPRYRVGRVFLAGDAAHVHSPAGGQGMNTGMQDAANLSWKLAAVLHGRAPESLLDSYHDERHPVGRMVLRTSGALIRLALWHTPPQRALRSAAARLLTRLGPVSRRALGTLSGVGISYPAAPGAHPLAGRRAPDVPLADGSRLYAQLRHGGFVLITPADEQVPTDERVPADETTPGGDAQSAAAGASPEPTRGARPCAPNSPVVQAHWRSARRTALLVRPDGYIAWATDATDPAERAAALRTALTRWTGTPAPRPPDGTAPAPSPAHISTAG